VVASVVATESPYDAPDGGKSDATNAIQSAVDAVAQAGGGVVFLPAGRYLCKGDLTIKEGVTLRGDYLEPDPDHNRYRAAGTILMPTADRGNANGTPFINLQRGSGVRNLSVWYPNQVSSNIVAYPWTVSTDQTWTGDCFTIEYVTLVNSYQGIRFGPIANEIGTVRHVYGAPLFTGISADQIYDVPRIEHLRLSSHYWTQSGLPGSDNAEAIRAQLLANATGVEMRRVDWYFLFDVEIYGYSIGYHLTKSEHGAACGAMYEASALGGNVGVQADQTGIAFQFTNCRFDGATAAIYASPLFKTELQLNNCRLGGQAKHAIQLEGRGILKAQNCQILGNIGPAVEADAGQLQLICCTYPGNGVKVLLARPVDRALIIGGITVDQVTNLSRGDIQVDPASLVSARPGDAAIVLPEDRRPARPLFFNVLDFGAKSDGDNPKAATDNTAAFQFTLDAAGKAGGGTVYVPAGSYRFNGLLRVPTGVELRGVFDIPHHTISWGSVLLPTAGRGSEAGEPFISLESGSGARGLTFWYPDQKADHIVPYPWTIRAKGPRCWLIDDTTANSYQFVDFGSYPSNGSLIRFVSGAPLRRGIWVSKGNAEVDDGMFNGHYWLRRPDRAPAMAIGNQHNAEDLLMEYMKEHLDAFIFGDCPKTQQVDNFVYGCKNGLYFVADNGRAASGIVINHGSDGATEGIHIESDAPGRLQFINTQIANVGLHARTAVEIAQAAGGPIDLFNGESWGIPILPTMIIHGHGQTTIQNWGTQQMGIKITGGNVTIQGCSWPDYALGKQVNCEGLSSTLTLMGNTNGAEKFAFDRAPITTALHNGADIPPRTLGGFIIHWGRRALSQIQLIAAAAALATVWLLRRRRVGRITGNS